MANKKTIDNILLVDNGDGSYAVSVSFAGEITVTNLNIPEPLSVDDNDGSLTVDGTVTANLSATDRGYIDGLEALLASLAVVGGGAEATAVRVTLANDSTGVISVDDGGGILTVDGTVTANLGATDNAVLDSILAALDGVEGLLTTIDGDTGNLSVVGGGTEAAAIRVTIASDSTGVMSIDDNAGSLTVDGNVGGKTKRVNTNVTRPANATQYAGTATAPEVINATSPTVLTFLSIATANAGTGVILTATISHNESPVTAPNLRLYLFTGDAAPAPDSDNAALTLADAEVLNLICVIDFADETWYEGTASANAFIQKTGLMIPFNCGPNVDDIFGVLTVTNSYTPVSGEVFTVVLGVSQD